MINTSCMICDKCNSTKFEMHAYLTHIGDLPFMDYVYYCKKCGEMYIGDRERFYIKTSNIHTGITELENK